MIYQREINDLLEASLPQGERERYQVIRMPPVMAWALSAPLMSPS
jgi:hypothetical protein